MSLKNILVIGGSYFAGRALVQHLSSKADMNVTVFNRGNIPLGISSVVQVKGDRTVQASLNRNIPNLKWDVLIDFCGYAPEDIDPVFEVLGNRVGYYIFISSTSVYDHTQALPMTENSRTVSKPGPELGALAEYGYQKKEAENRLKALCGNTGLPFTILRPAIIYGPFNYAPRENYFFDIVEQGLPVIIPENNLSLFSFLYVDDLARIIVACFDNEVAKDRTINTLAPELFSYRRYVEVLEQVSGMKLKIYEMPLEQIIEKQIGLPFPIDHHQIYSTDTLGQCFDFEFTPLYLGLEKTYRFYQYLKKKTQEANNDGRV